MRETTSDEQLIGIADGDLRLVEIDERLGELLGARDLGARSLLEVLPPSIRPLLRLTVRRITREVVLPVRDRGDVLVARAAIVGDETWLLLFERSARRSRPRSRSPRIVGRQRELAAIDDYLAEPGDSILYLQGPLGIGKTALLSALAVRCDELGCPRFWIDARTIPPTPEAVAHVITGGPISHRPLERLHAAHELGTRGWVIVIDNFDAWQDQAGHTGERPCAHLPPECRIVVAARRAPNPLWWSAAMRAPRTIRLAVLGDADAAELGASLGIPPEQASEASRRAAGHPLCIVAMASALRAGAPLAHTAPPLDLELASVGPREVLEAAAVPSRITEDVLEALLDDADPAAAFDLLTTVAVPDRSGFGLRMPVVVRDTLTRRIRERNPSRHAELQQRLAFHVGSQLEAGSPLHLVPIIEDFFDSLDDQLPIQRVLGSRLDGLPSIRPAWPNDLPAVTAAARALGDERVAKTILARTHAGFATTYIGEGPTGIEVLCQYATITPASAAKLAEVRDDSELGAALEVLRRRITLAARESALVILAWCARDVARGHWGPPSQAMLRHLLTTLMSKPQAAANVLILPNEDFPLPMLARGTPDGPFVVGRHSVLFRDLRGMTATTMLIDLLRSNESRPPLRLPEAVLPTATITAETVREALMLVDRPERLIRSQLLSLRTIELEVGGDSTETATTMMKALALERLLRETVASLGTGRGEAKQREALVAVFFVRESKHETIAAELGMPYSTFRRCLARGIERVAELLRIREEAVRRTAGGQR
ncbi:MAG: hypothetical protein BGO98_12990 [Myxococcales bacterium 68-20]|nr:MAG: hypothetical protein BGO98_12990 [Myxococcales bacterium 68-20]